jgi:hypothetical protein
LPPSAGGCSGRRIVIARRRRTVGTIAVQKQREKNARFVDELRPRILEFASELIGGNLDHNSSRSHPESIGMGKEKPLKLLEFWRPFSTNFSAF